MSARTPGSLIAMAIIVCLSLFSTCGEIDTLFPSTGSYQVKTLVNGASLEDCSMIRSSDKIRPYFAVSVVDDPDLIGLLVYLQDSQGKIIGEKLQYTLEPYAEETPQKETTAEKEAQPDETGTADSGETGAVDETETSLETSPAASENDQVEEALAERTAAREKWGFADSKKAGKKYDVEIAVLSFAEELPYFPLPKNMEIGSYVLVFEAIGKRETLSRTEATIFYLGSAEFNLKDISMYLPGFSDSQLIAPGTTVMLESRLDFDSRLDPYVIWYSGKNIISEGKFSDGAGEILWTAPAQAAFCSLRLEAFPFRLNRNNFSGVSREITLPVSARATSLGYFFKNNPEKTVRNALAAGTAYPEHRLAAAVISTEDNVNAETEVHEYYPPELIQLYQFEYSLHDSASAVAGETMAPSVDTAPRWAATGQIYGLSIGLDDPYMLSPVHFLHDGENQGGGIFLFHIKPPAEGAIFSAFFPPKESSAAGVLMELIREKNCITLRLSTGSASVEMPMYLTAYELQGLIPIVVEFYIRPYRMEAKISLNEHLQSSVKEIRLSGALSGESRIRLGGGLGKAGLDNPVSKKPGTEAVPPKQIAATTTAAPKPSATSASVTATAATTATSAPTTTSSSTAASTSASSTPSSSTAVPTSTQATTSSTPTASTTASSSTTVSTSTQATTSSTPTASTTPSSSTAVSTSTQTTTSSSSTSSTSSTSTISTSTATSPSSTATSTSASSTPSSSSTTTPASTSTSATAPSTTASSSTTTQPSSTSTTTSKPATSSTSTSTTTPVSSAAAMEDALLADNNIFSVEEPGFTIPAAEEPFETNAIWDEFAILLSSVPLLPEAITAATITEEDAVMADESKNETTAIQQNNKPAETKNEAIKPAPAEQAVKRDEESNPAGTEDAKTPETEVDINMVPVMENSNTDASIQERELAVLSEDI